MENALNVPSKLDRLQRGFLIGSLLISLTAITPKVLGIETTISPNDMVSLCEVNLNLNKLNFALTVFASAIKLRQSFKYKSETRTMYDERMKMFPSRKNILFTIASSVISWNAYFNLMISD